MEPAAILFLLIVLAIIVHFVTRPFFKRQRVQAVESSHEYSSLLAERERLLTALQELDFDQTLGKIPTEDYPSQRATLLQKGAEVLRQLDAISPSLAKQAGGKDPGTENASNLNAPLSDDDLEELLSKHRNTRKDKTAGFCPKCGKPILQADVFCPSCGHPLE